jgi:acetyl esterase/lipase
MLRSLVLGLPLLGSAVAAFSTLFIVVPAPARSLWLLAVAASEWSLWFGALGLLGAVLSLLALAYEGHPAAFLGVGLGLLAVALALVPPLQARHVAEQYSIQLSLRRYLFGQSPPQGSSGPQLLQFATVDGQPLMLDAYLPSDRTALHPAIMVLHGGSWSSGDKGDFPQWNHWLVEQGYAVFDVQYRLAPQPNWRSATGDVKCAIGWVKRNAVEYGVDPLRIALLGRSAGGHLALLAAYTPLETDLPPSCPAPDTTVQAVIAFYAPTDLAWGYEHPANQRVIDGPGTLRRFLGGDPDTVPDAFRTASPTTHVGAQTPPTLLFHGGHDQLVRDTNTELLAKALAEAGVAHQAIYLPYAQHGFDYNFNGWGSQIARPLMVEFLERWLSHPAHAEP